MDVYIYQAALLCEECGEEVRNLLTKKGNAPADPDDEGSYDSDDFPKGSFPDGGGEADAPQHCDSCGLFLENPLTEEGFRYVREAVWQRYMTKHPTGNSEVVAEWKDFYDIDNPADAESNDFDDDEDEEDDDDE